MIKARAILALPAEAATARDRHDAEIDLLVEQLHGNGRWQERNSRTIDLRGKIDLDSATCLSRTSAPQ